MKPLSNASQVGLLVEFPSDGKPIECNHLVYWATEFKNTVLRHSERFFPDVNITLNNEGRCKEVLFYKNNDSGEELASESISIREGAKIPCGEVRRLQAVIEQLHSVSQSNSCSPAIAGFLREFRLPNPDAMPEAWRVAPKEKKLIVLWGYTKGATTSTFLPSSKAAEEAKWNDSTSRLSLETRLRPYTTGFYLTKPMKMLLCLLLAVLVIVGLIYSCSQGKEKPAPDGSEVVNTGNTTENPADAVETAETKNGQGNAAEAADMLPREERTQVIKAFEEKLAKGEPLTKEEQKQYQKCLLKNLEEDTETLHRLVDEDVRATQENNMKLGQTSKNVTEMQDAVFKDTSVPQEIRSDIKDESKRKAVERKVAERIQKGTATKAEKDWHDSAVKQDKLRDEIQKSSQERTEKLGDSIVKAQKSRERAIEAGALPGKVCPDCGSTDAMFGCSVQNYDLNPDNADNYCSVTLKFAPRCKSVQDFDVDYFKVGYLFKRDFYWDPVKNTLDFKLKRSEVKDGNLRLLATAKYTHAGERRATEFALTMTIESTERTTIKGINVSPR